MTIDIKAIREVVETAIRLNWSGSGIPPSMIIALLDRLEAAEKKIADLEQVIRFHEHK